MTADIASSSSSSKSKLWNYDVFLSFRGEDTHKGFTSHLQAALKDEGYQAYMDDDNLKRGEEIKEELFRAIEESRISIIVFSKRYADSSWCLDELVKIMECRYKLGRHVLPIFYHVDPSHVRKQNGVFAQAFQNHKMDIRKEKDDKEREAKKERVKQWRKALTEAANLSGHHLQITNNGCEEEFIRKIVDENILEWLTSTNKLHVAKHQVGIDSRIQDVITYLLRISVLLDRCLVTIERNMLNMHDLLREMARVIISEKSPGHPGSWSRLWNRREVIDVLRNKSGTEEVEGLALTESICLSTVAFANMKKLKFLKLSYVKLMGEYKHLPKELIWLCWRGFSLKSIPDDFFDQPRLVVLDMQSSKLVKVWEGSKSLQKLKIINLTYSIYLKKLPDFSQVPNLEELILVRCESLSEIHPSIGHLKRLSLVDLTCCRMLTSLPREFYKSKSVETLLLGYCSNFRELHEDLGEMLSMRILEAVHTTIRQVPPSILRLKNLTHLSLQRVKLADDEIPKDLGSLISLQYLDLGENYFHTLPSLSGLSKLETLSLIGCTNLHTISDLPTSLKFLCAFNCPALETMPNFSEMSNMRKLEVSDSPKLTEVPGLENSLNSMTLIDMQWCTNLTTDFRKNILQGWTSCGFGGIFLHGNYVPDWFEFVNEGTKVSFDIPPSGDRSFEGLSLFCLYHSYERSPLPPPLAITVINNTKCTELRANIVREERNRIYYKPESYHIWHGQLSKDKLNLQDGDKVNIIFEDSFASSHPDYYMTMKRTGVNLIWDKPMKENMHNLDKAGYVFDSHPARFYDEGGPSHDTFDNNHHPMNSTGCFSLKFPKKNDKVNEIILFPSLYSSPIPFLVPFSSSFPVIIPVIVFLVAKHAHFNILCIHIMRTLLYLKLQYNNIRKLAIQQQYQF
ncbi:unnamed protein product [Malus baccata var. baccata]